MELLAIVQARTLAFLELMELNPRGRVFFPELVQELVQRYRFQKFPQKFEEFDENKGIEFFIGKTADNVINKFTIFSTLLAIETRSSTTDSKAILEEMLEWGKTKLGLNYLAEKVKWAYVSEVIFQTNSPLIRACSSPLTKLADKTGHAVSQIWGEAIAYEPALIQVAHDPLTRKYTVASFQINQFRDHPFAENKYYSQAPLPTDMHIRFLEEFEADVLAAK